MTNDLSSQCAERKEMSSRNKRRDSLGVEVNNLDFDLSSFFEGFDSWYIRGYSSAASISSQVLSRADRWKMLHRARSFLARRSFSDFADSVPSSYCRGRKFNNLLDYFPALKYSYSAPLPGRVLAGRRGCSAGDHVRFLDIYQGSFGKARLSDLSRSGSIRLDPVDAPRQLFLYRQRIQRCISWGYSIGLVPLMMTVTVFHRWHPLRGLLNVLGKAWNYFFTGSTAAVKRAKRMGVSGYIRRAEETINNTKGGYNSGWHPHYHVILFVPRDKVSVVASMEEELREAWFSAVNRFFVKEFGESIDSGYEASFRRHGLFFSRRVQRSGSDVLRHVDDGEYMAKVFGCDSSSFYSGDSELTSMNVKDSRVPFDLLLEDTAENGDLWVEYALATKGVRSFVFSHGLESRVNDYFVAHPDDDPVEALVKSPSVIAQIGTSLYKLIERHFKVDEMLRVASGGYDALREWFVNFYKGLGISIDDISDSMLPLFPGSRTLFGELIGCSVFPNESSTNSSVAAVARVVSVDNTLTSDGVGESLRDMVICSKTVVDHSDELSCIDFSRYTAEEKECFDYVVGIVNDFISRGCRLSKSLCDYYLSLSPERCRSIVDSWRFTGDKLEKKKTKDKLLPVLDLFDMFKRRK